MPSLYRVYFKDGLVLQSFDPEKIGIFMLGREMDKYKVMKDNIQYVRTEGCDIRQYIKELEVFNPNSYIEDELFEL